MNIITDAFEKDLPLVPLKDSVIFPGTVVNVTFNDPKDIESLNRINEGEEILVVTLRDETKTDEQDVFSVGTKGKVREKTTTAGEARLLYEATERVKIIKAHVKKGYLQAKYEASPKNSEVTNKTIALRNAFLLSLNELVSLGKTFPIEVILRLPNITDPNDLIDNTIPFIIGNVKEKQEILEAIDINERFEKANKLILRAMEVQQLEGQIESKTQEEISKNQREIFLREELKTIQKELGEEDSNEYESLRNKIEISGMPKEVYEIALKELNRLIRTPVFSPETSYIRNYLEWLTEMPWNKYSESKIDIKEAKKILDQDHFGLDKVKERILEYLAVQQMVEKIKGPILCFVGPPGTGKTSVGQSIAKAMGRSFARISLGGIHDEAEIRGHRRTYIGAMPGRIIQGVKKSGTKNPVFMLDEIDKIGMDFRGDPSAALLEALDPEQNSNFSDHYLEVPFDLSDVIFIMTANILDTIPPALLDRMEIINFPGYSALEKFQIAKSFILPKVLSVHGLKENQFDITDEGLKEVIDKYTFEAGVRSLERVLSKLARKIALKISEKGKTPKEISPEIIKNLLGPSKIEKWVKEVKSQVGLVAGLAVTGAGGEVLSVEANLMPGGRGDLILTGQLGDVMKESARIAFSYARSISNGLKVNPNITKENDIHVHVPAGAIPKDGPSAGIAIATAIASAISKKPISHNIGMTGEITLRGRVLRIGGVKEKILAAKRARLKEIILPEANRNEVEDLDTETTKGIKIDYVKEMNEALEKALER